jgi:hypothetical protein
MKNLNLTLILLFLAVISFAQNLPSYVPANGLVGWWPFNGNAVDESINTNDGTVNGATLTADRFGNANSAYSFNGTNNKIVVNDATPLRLNNTDFTISFWTYINSYNSSGGTAFIYKRGAPTQDGWGVAASQGVQNKMTFGVGGGGDPRGYSNSTLGLNGWHHVTIVYTLTIHTLKFYIDGLLDNTTTGVDGNNLPVAGGMPSPNASCTSVMYFGQDTRNNNYWLSGKLDDIGCWNRNLTQQEITNLYNGNLCFQTITVTDTLLINTNITGYNPVTYENTIRIWPNPTYDHITIDAGNLNTMSGYSIRIVNALGQQVFQSAINQQQFYLDLSSWTGNGIYYVNIINPQGVTIDTRKIVLQ